MIEKRVCNKCGRNICSKKFKKIPHNYQFFCTLCYMVESNNHFTARAAQINDNDVEYMEIMKKCLRTPNFRIHGMSDEEMEVLRDKHSN